MLLCPSLKVLGAAELECLLAAQAGARPATSQSPFIFSATSHRPMACAPARPRPARGALGQSAPRCPAVATVDIGFFKAATPGSASSRQTSRCESSVSLTSRIHSSPAHFCLQYNTASAPKLGSLCGSSLLAFVFFLFTLYAAQYRSVLPPYPSSPLFEPRSGPRRKIAGLPTSTIYCSFLLSLPVFFRAGQPI